MREKILAFEDVPEASRVFSRNFNFACAKEEQEFEVTNSRTHFKEYTGLQKSITIPELILCDVR